jgi:hypothetical protein
MIWHILNDIIYVTRRCGPNNSHKITKRENIINLFQLSFHHFKKYGCCLWTYFYISLFFGLPWYSYEVSTTISDTLNYMFKGTMTLLFRSIYCWYLLFIYTLHILWEETVLSHESLSLDCEETILIYRAHEFP